VEDRHLEFEVVFIRFLARRLGMAALKVGEMAPDFEVPAVVGTEKITLKLSDYRGRKNVLLAFYPLDWTPV
jgi:peroxiredoxin